MVDFSLIESKYVALIESMKEALWLQGIPRRFGMNINGVPIHYDSQSTIFISRNPMFHECTKHMDMKLYFIKDII